MWPSFVITTFSSVTVIRPSSLASDARGALRKPDSGAVCCHQQAGTNSASSRGRRSSRYAGMPSISTSTSSPWSTSRNTPNGSFWSSRDAHDNGCSENAPNPTSTSHEPSTSNAMWSNGGPNRSPLNTRAASSSTEWPKSRNSSANNPLSS